MTGRNPPEAAAQGWRVAPAGPEDSAALMRLAAETGSRLQHAALDILLADGRVWAARSDGEKHRLIGLAAAGDLDGALTIEAMGVAPTWRGRGVGDALLAEVERFARWAYYPAMFAFPPTRPETRFYQAHGFILVEPERVSGPLKRRARGMPPVVKRL